MTGDQNLMKMAENIIKTFAETINQYPSGYTQFLCALDFAIGPTKEIIIASEPDQKIRS